MSEQPSPSDEHLRRLERLYLGARCNEFYRPRLQIGSDATVELTIDVRDEFLHAAGGVHGSVYFKLLDDAAFFAANSRLEGEWVLTVSFQIEYMQPVTGGQLHASGRLLHASRRRYIAESELRDSAGTLLAIGRGTFLASGIPLGATIDGSESG